MSLNLNESFTMVEGVGFPNELLGAVWHTTSLSRYRKITKSGAILAEPSLTDNERHGTGGGSKLYPFVRSIGGVSVFDFREFNPIKHYETFKIINWPYFVFGHNHEEDSVWIEIDTDDLSDSFKSAQEIRKMWHKQNSNRKFMTGIEGAILGSVSINAFKAVLIYSKDTGEFIKLINS